MEIDIFKKQCEASVVKFKDRIGKFDYIANGILLWEGLAFCSMLDMCGIDMIIESGVAGGASTEIWAKYFSGKIYAIDSSLFYGPERFAQTADRLRKYTNVELINGDSFFEMEKIIKKNLDKKIAIFIDGPKGKAAEVLAKKMFFYNNVIFAGIHDQNSRDGGHPMDGWEKSVFFTDSPWFVEKYSFLDRELDSPLLEEQLKNKPGGLVIGFAENCGKKGSLIEINTSFYKEKIKSFLFSFLIGLKKRLFND